jgi:3-oxoacyl-[acyl-carrier-protein] synthase II
LRDGVAEHLPQGSRLGAIPGRRARRVSVHVVEFVTFQLGDAVTQVPVSSTKSITGHLLSAAAAMETLASVVAIASQAIPPTINLDHPDPECELHHVAHYARDAAVDVVLSNSFGFGGNNTSLVLRRAA